MSSRHKTVVSNSTNRTKDENDDKNNRSETHTESLKDQTCAEPNTYVTEITQQKPLQFYDSWYSESFTEQAQKPSLQLQ